jgi:hypothetical protein
MFRIVSLVMLVVVFALLMGATAIDSVVSASVPLSLSPDTLGVPQLPDVLFGCSGGCK